MGKIKSLKFHIDNNDYFGTLATVLSLLEQDMRKNGVNKKHFSLLQRKVEELMYLQNNFKILKN